MTAETLTKVDSATPRQVDHCANLAMTVFHQNRYLDDSASVADRNASAQWLIGRGFIGCDGRMIVLRGAK